MLIKAFIDSLRYERALSERTVEEYRSDLKAFEAFFKSLDDNLTWNSVDTDVAREWVVDMMERGNKASSVQRRLSAVRTFYRYLMKHELVERDPVRNLASPKKERPLPAFIRDDEMQRLLDHDGMFDDTFEGRRDRLIIELFYETGLRLSELTGLDVDNIDLAAQTIRVRGKGDKERLVPFGDRLLHIINIYIGERKTLPAIDAQAFFVTAKGARLKGPQVSRMVKAKLGLVTMQRKRSPHVLRHTFATTMLNHDADLQTVKELLGHERLQTTEIYTHTTFEELKQVYAHAHPRAAAADKDN